MRAAPAAVCIRHSCESISLFLCVCRHEPGSQPASQAELASETNGTWCDGDKFARDPRRTRCERISCASTSRHTCTQWQRRRRRRWRRRRWRRQQRQFVGARSPFSTWNDDDPRSRFADVKVKEVPF